MKIEEVESRLEKDLAALRSPAYDSLEAIRNTLVPPGHRIRISLLDKKGRKKRKNASADSWSPEEGEIRISFEPEPLSELSRLDASIVPVIASAEAQVHSDPLSDLVRVLDGVESRPGYGFVALKWFRDVALPAADLEWVRSESIRQKVLREAIDQHLVLTGKVQNPKAPQFPTTAIRLNRILPGVKAILGEKQSSVGDFEPVNIRGESLSNTVLRERR
jgi:hypothetical protein